MSKIEVDAITQQSGSTLTVGGGASKTVVADATTVTLGRCGGTVALASGATQSGFGRTGTVDWQTAIKTSTFTAVSGEGYFVNTTGGVITVNLPAGSAGAIVSIKDYAQTFDTNACTIAANGSEKIEGLTGDLNLTTESIAVTLVYGDATKGWQAVNSNEVKNALLFVSAAGGTETTSGDFKIHTFTGPGNFTVNCAGNAGGSNTVDYLVVAGGGGTGAPQGSGGGGAGGYRESSGAASGCYSVSPLGSGVSAVPVTTQAYPITVGAGGSQSTNGNPGSNSIFSTIISTGGGGGGQGGSGCNGLPGGSGGAGGGRNARCGGAGNTPPVSPPQGKNGGAASAPSSPTCSDTGGGGGGATAAGGNGSPNGPGGAGGAGATSSINATPTARAGGGGGGSQIGSGGAAGPGGGGTGNSGGGTANTGGGAGGAGTSGSYAGGSGIVIIRYKFQ